MKKIGLIGGTGPESTLIYYKKLNEKIYGITGSFPEMTVESVNLFKALAYCENNDLNGLFGYLYSAAENLIISGCDILALTANTLHIVFEELKNAVPVPFISITEAAADYAGALGVKKPVLLGTKFTMEAEFFGNPFEKRSIRLVTPGKKDRDFINGKISGELEAGIISSVTKAEITEIVNRIIGGEGADGVILGCTELPLLFGAEDFSVPVIDTMEIHIRKLAEAALNG